MIGIYFWKILGIGAAVYIFYDNYKKNRTGLGLILAAITLFFPFFAIFYLNFKSKKPLKNPKKNTELPQSFCPKCGHTNNKNLSICGSCKNMLTL